MMRYFCCDDSRRTAVRLHDPAAHAGIDFNGIDFLEVGDENVDPSLDNQRHLFVHVIKPLTGELLARLTGATPQTPALTPDNVRITGGERVTGIQAIKVDFDAVTNVLEVETDKAGDTSSYNLSLQEASGNLLPGMDQMLSSVDFNFKIDCPTDLDCETEQPCPPETLEQPEIDYLAKDYASFRRLMLDRLSVIAPAWQERSPTDLGVALVELLAYTGDYLSYEQDAIATEAYLGTARLRASVRRHARMLDYQVQDGCNARVWVQVRVKQTAPGGSILLPAQTRMLTTITNLPSHIKDVTTVERFNPVVFETMHEARLFPDCHEFRLYTWGAEECCLPEGATKATLDGHHPNLAKGQVIVFVEAVGPRTGGPADADPRHRHAVRLTELAATRDALLGKDVTEIEWADEDALPFVLCISSLIQQEDGSSQELNNVSVARGNIVLADHGLTVSHDLDVVPQLDPRLARVTLGGGSQCDPGSPDAAPVRYRPALKQAPLTMAATVQRNVDGRRRREGFDPDAPAAAAFVWGQGDILASIRLTDQDARQWIPRRDLLGSDEFAPEFVPEVDDAGLATLRFGDDEYGMRPGAGSTFVATYRVGNGVRGNVGADSIGHISAPFRLVPDDPSHAADLAAIENVEGLGNPMPARGGQDPESMQSVRASAPFAFRVKQRAVTTDDYAELTQRSAQVQRAAASMRWTGSWRTVFLNVDRESGGGVDAQFEAQIRQDVERYRMAGHDLEVAGPIPVSLEVDLSVCAHPDYYRSDVKSALLQALSSRVLPDGLMGFFHPDRFSFGQPVYLSQLIAAAQAVQGVATVEVRKFQRLGIESRAGIDDGLLKMGRLEIARLDDDPNFPDRGILTLTVEGGR
jgi:hypothetical protein